MKKEKINEEYLYFCEKMKPNKLGFREKQWLDTPCKGWRVLSKRGICQVDSGLRY